MTTTEITTQEIFNRVRDHLLAQNAQSMRYAAGDVDPDPQCAYRGSDGLKCAVGILISDAHYDQGLECYGANCAPVRLAVCASLGVAALSEDAALLLNDLQVAHDENCAAAWPLVLDRIAEHQGLEP